jgi:pyocin large subunit-like protein
MGLLDVHELTDWRNDPLRVKALAAWLADQVYEDSPQDAEMADDETVRIVEAARRAVADVDRTGRADIALTAIGKDHKEQPFDVRRSVDANELQSIVTEFEETERVTTRTRTWGP